MRAIKTSRQYNLLCITNAYRNCHFIYMPIDSARLRDELHACLPSLVIDSVAKESGQRVVYFGHFDDHLIPNDLPEDSTFLRDWGSWGNIVAKVVSGIDATSLTYLQREVAVLTEI